MKGYTKKAIHISIITIIIVAIAFTALILVLRYIENGETNMPFNISKITIISTTDAQDIEDQNNIWNESVSQNNDVYIDIEKNEKYGKNWIIKQITLDNYQVLSKPKIGEIIIYRPSTNQLATFENDEKYQKNEIVYTGSKSTDLQNLEIANQGGRIAFRCSNVNLGSYISNDGNDLEYSALLKKIGITNESIQAKISFDVKILLTNGKLFKTTIEIDIPVDDLVSSGKTSKEIKDLNIVFKRIEN